MNRFATDKSHPKSDVRGDSERSMHFLLRCEGLPPREICNQLTLIVLECNSEALHRLSGLDLLRGRAEGISQF